MSKQQPKPLTQRAELQRLKQEENKKNLLTLLKYYETFKFVVGEYCKKIPYVHPKLNLAYLNLVRYMNALVDDLGLSPDGQSPLRLQKYFIPFESLLGAEEEMGGSLDLGDVMRKVNSSCNEIKMLFYKKVRDRSVPEIMQMRDELNMIRTLIEDVHKERSEMPISHSIPTEPASAFKALHWETVMIRFINERDVVVAITTTKVQRQTDCEALGFLNHKTQKPNTAWMFLYNLSLNNGETKQIKYIPENIRKHKEALSKGLKAVFGLDSDPILSKFGRYKIKIQLVPPGTAKEEQVEKRRKEREEDDSS